MRRCQIDILKSVRQYTPRLAHCASSPRLPRCAREHPSNWVKIPEVKTHPCLHGRGTSVTAPFSTSATMAPHVQDQVQLRSLTEPESFWAHQAERLHWHKEPSRTLQISETALADPRSYPHWSWFPDGEISTCYNCVDRHVLSGHGESSAIIWDSPVTSTKQMFTYRDVLGEVETLAGVLREEGVRRGDVVLVYSR